jgi:RNA polymerase sigma-70 factor (ECF subfamily)
MRSDEELMSAVALGDEAALGMLVGRHAPRLRAYLQRYTVNPEDADDLLQEAWVRVARSARRYDSRRRFRSWLYGIATNLARDLFRRRATRERALGELAMRPRVEPEVGPVDRNQLHEQIARLPEDRRAVLHLRYFEGMNEIEMAEALGIPRGTVKSRLHAAIRELRSEYKVLP